MFFNSNNSLWALELVNFPKYARALSAKVQHVVNVVFVLNCLYVCITSYRRVGLHLNSNPNLNGHSGDYVINMELLEWDCG